MRLLPMLFGILLLVSSGFAVDISTCDNITSPGVYALNTTLVGYPNPATEASGIDFACIKIASSDVIFDCGGYSLWGNDSSVPDTTVGILVNESVSSNVTIQNWPNLWDYNHGILVEDANEVVIRNVTSHNHDTNGITLRNSNDSQVLSNNLSSSFLADLDASSCYNLTLRDNIATNRVSTLYAYTLSDVHESTIINNTAIAAANIGFDAGSSSNNTYINNTASGNIADQFRILSVPAFTGNTYINNTAIGGTGGFILGCTFDDPTGILLENNTVYDTSTGVSIGCSGVTLIGNNISEASSRGVYSRRVNNTLIGNEIYNNDIGIEVETPYDDYSFDTQDNKIYGNTEYGVYYNEIENASITMLRDQIYNNTIDMGVEGNQEAPDSNLTLVNVLFGNSGLANFANISMFDIVKDGNTYTLDYTTPVAPPANYISFLDKFVDIVFIDTLESFEIESIAWYWSNTESPSYSEERLQLWKYNASGWLPLNNTPDTAANELSLTMLDEFSDFGILADNRSANVSMVKTDITPFPASPGGLIQYNLTITNTGNITINISAVVDIIPAGLTWVATSPGNASLAPGNSTSIFMNATVDAGVVDSTSRIVNLTNYANVSATDAIYGDSNTSSEDTVNSTVYYANISVNKTIDNSTTYTYQNKTFNVTINNTGEVNLSVNVVDILPMNTSFEGATTAPTTVLGQTVAWQNLITLAPGESTLLQYNVSANRSGDYQNNVTVTGIPLNGDNVTANDSANFTVYDWPDDQDPPGPESFSIGFEASCDGNIVHITGADDPDGFTINVYDAVTFADVASGETNGSGQFVFEGCGQTVRINANKDGYSPESLEVSLIDCELCLPPQCVEDADCPATYQCVEETCVPVECLCGAVQNHQCVPYECCADTDCPEGQICENHQCREVTECTSDDDCAGNEYCAADGTCQGVIGQCGYPENHEWVQYECGDEEGCPDCPEESVCIEHVCVPVTLEGPETVFVGEDGTVTATEGGEPCRFCDIEILTPDGRRVTGQTDENGVITIPVTMEGTYSITLLKDGEPVAGIAIEGLPLPEEIEEPPPTAVLSDLALWLLWLLILIGIILVIIVYRRSKQEKR